MDNTKGSKYYKNQQKRDEQVQGRIRKMLSKLQSSSKTQKAAASKLVSIYVYFQYFQNIVSCHISFTLLDFIATSLKYITSYDSLI